MEEEEDSQEATEVGEEENEDIDAELSEGENWVDDLYQKIIAGDAEGVFGIITASDFIDKCEMFPYEVVAWSNDYRLTTSDGKFIWVVKEIDGVFLSVAYHPDHNYYDPAWGTPEVFEGSYVYEIDFDGSKSWLFKSTGHEEDGSTYELQEGALWKRIFHM